MKFVKRDIPPFGQFRDIGRVL